MNHNHITGLTTEQVLESRMRHGSNVLTPPAREPLWRQFLKKFNDPLIKILLVALILSVALSLYEYFGLHQEATVLFEPIGIFVAIVLATLVGFLVEVNANKSSACSIRPMTMLALRSCAMDISRKCPAATL